MTDDERREEFTQALLKVKAAAGLYADVRPHMGPVLEAADREQEPLRAEIDRLTVELQAARSDREYLDRVAGLRFERLEREHAATREKLERALNQIAKLEHSETELIKERNHLHDVADQLAYAVAPIEVIGEHSSGNSPWGNALDLITPAAEVKRLREELERERRRLQKFAARLNELEVRICTCTPEREHRDLHRPALYRHAADCAVNGG